MIGKKEKSCSLKKIESDSFIFGNNDKGEVIGVVSVKPSSSCKLIEVYLMDRIIHNILSISEFCDAGFDVSFNIKNCSIKHEKRKITLLVIMLIIFIF